MKRFKPIIIDLEKKIFINTENLLMLYLLYRKYANFIDDDFAQNNETNLQHLLKTINKLSPYFFEILDPKTQNFAGFVYLDNFVGNSKILHSAEITACLFKKYWGNFTYLTAQKFLNFCFHKLKLKKLKALIYPQNFRVKPLLKKINFKKEATLIAETVKNGEFQDIEVFSILKER